MSRIFCRKFNVKENLSMILNVYAGIKFYLDMYTLYIESGIYYDLYDVA